MGRQLVSKNERNAEIGNLIERMKPQFAAAIGQSIPIERFARLSLTMAKNPSLMKCETNSIIAALMECAQLKLEPDGILGQAYLVPFKGKCQFIPGYQGLMTLARRSGEIEWIDANIVYENDSFRQVLGGQPTLDHVPADGDRGEVVRVYAIAKLTNGHRQFAVMTKEEVEAIRSRSPAGKSGPWVTDWDWMAKKTAIRQLCKMLPKSIELQRAVALDELASTGIEQNLSATVSYAQPAEVVVEATPEPVGDVSAPEPTESTPDTGAPLSEAEKREIEEEERREAEAVRAEATGQK